MDITILQRYNVDKDAFSAFLKRLGYTLKSTGADGNELWNAPDDTPGDTSLTIKQAGKDYNVHVWSAKAAPLEQGADYSFSDARMKLEGIDAAELTRRLVNEGYSDDKPKGKQTSSFAVRQAQTSAKPKPKYQFPSSLKLDEDSLLLPNGGELKQDPLVLDVYRGQLTGNVVENFAFIYRDSDGKPASLAYRIKYKGNDNKDIRLYSFSTESGTFTSGGVDKKNRRLLFEESARELSTIIYCEGEKKTFDLQRFLLVQGIDNVGATTAGGSNDVNADVIREALGGKNVYIIPDADPPGCKCAEEVRRALLGTGSPPVPVWKWNDDKSEGYDIANLLEEQGDKLAAGSSDLDSFLRSLEGLGAGSWTDGAFLSDYEKEEAGAGVDDEDDEDVEETLAELYEDNPQMPPFLIPDLIRENDTVALTAQGGVGKSWFSISLAYAVATGTKFFDRFDALGVEKNVYFVNPEMTRASIEERFKTFTKERLKNIHFLHWDKVRKKMKRHPKINLADEFWLNFIERKIQKFKIDLLVIDSFLQCYTPEGVSSNAAEFANRFNDLILMCRDNNCTMLAVVHDGKDPQKEGRGTSAILDMPELSLKISKPDKRFSDGKEAEFNLSFGLKNRNGVPEVPFYARRDRKSNRWVTKSADDIREAAREEQSKQENYALELFRDGKTPGELNSTEYAGLVPEKGLNDLYNDYMPTYLAKQIDNGEPLKNLLDRFPKPLVRRVILNNYPHNYGTACALLYEAGDDKKSILQAYRAIRPGAPEPPELTKAEAERTAQKNEERKAEYFKQLDEGLRADELRKLFPMAPKLHTAYYAEWSADRAREQIQGGVDIRDIVQARLSDNRNKFDLVAVATTYIGMKDDKQAALVELSTVEGIDKKTLGKVAQSFSLSVPSKPVGRPRKEKTKSDATTSAENIQKV